MTRLDTLATLAALALAQLASACSQAGEPVRDAAYFLDRLHELDDLPRLEPSYSGLSRNYDPAGGNDLDGFIFPGVEGFQNTLLELEGPGCIHRISTGSLELVEDTRVEIILDGETLLDMEARELFEPETGPFAGGLTLSGEYPTVRYPTIRMPIPFAESALVRLHSATQSWGIFWQIGYTQLPAGTPVETLRLPFDARTRAAFDRAGQAWDDALVGARRPAAADISLLRTLAPGESMRWEDSGCGTLERLALTLTPNTFVSWQGLRLRLRWDGAEQPAVDLPLAEFMGAGRYASEPDSWFHGLVMGHQGNSAYLRLPMPYRSAAELELANDASEAIELELGLWRAPCQTQPEDFGYLHAAVETAPAATPDSPLSGPGQVPVHRLLDRQGRGKVVGVQLRVDWPFSELWWGEGDWQIWADEPVWSWPPRYHGTGTEELFDGGWTRFNRKALSGAIKDRPGVVNVYGFMLNDAFNFEDEIRVQVETVGLLTGDRVIQQLSPLWSSTVYWYDAQPGR